MRPDWGVEPYYLSESNSIFVFGRSLRPMSSNIAFLFLDRFFLCAFPMLIIGKEKSLAMRLAYELSAHVIRSGVSSKIPKWMSFDLSHSLLIR